MQAIIIDTHGGIEALKLGQRETPKPQPNEVSVKIATCGINHLDLWVRKGVPGHRFPLPLIPGSDISGTVAGLGDNVTDLKVGDEVVCAPAVSCGTCAACASGRDHHCRRYGILGEHRDGGYSEYIALPRRNILPKPKNLSHAQAATIGVPFLTAWHMLVTRARIVPGETVMVWGAASGVGSAAIQIGKLFGAQVIAVAGSKAKLDYGVTLGADHTIDHSGESVAKRVKEITGGAGANVVIEHVGQTTWEQSLRSLAWHGRLVTCGATTGADAKIDLRHLFFKGWSIMGSTMGSLGEFHRVLDHFGSGALQPIKHTALPLAHAGEAHRRLEAGEVIGKVILEM